MVSALHQPVLEEKTLDLLELKSGQKVIDCTIGAGGHANSILQKIAPTGKLLGLDVDATALDIARTRLAAFADRTSLVQANFDQIAKIADEKGFWPVQAILADLGVSSMQLDRPERGFSFSREGPLDMRMGTKVSQSAAELINSLPEAELADIIYQYGEERRSRRIARAIVNARPLHSTQVLADIISKAVGGRRGQKIHPATRSFQAIRIAVNDELGAIERFLPQAIDILAPGGRLAVISFHSLEDRIVKHFFRREAKDCLCPPHQLDCTCNHQAKINIITRKVIRASEQEIAANPRARSARLRAVRRR